MNISNFFLIAEIIVFSLITFPAFFKIPVNVKLTDPILSIRNKQLGLLLFCVLWRFVDVVMLATGDTVRINSGTCMLAEQFTLLTISWVLLLEAALRLSQEEGARSSRYQHLAILLPLLFILPSYYLEMFSYIPTPARALCLFKAPSDTESGSEWLVSTARLLLTLWLPAHFLLVTEFCRRKAATLLSVAMSLTCVLLYLPELSHSGEIALHHSVSDKASTSRRGILLVLSFYLNFSVGAALMESGLS